MKIFLVMDNTQTEAIISSVLEMMQPDWSLKPLFDFSSGSPDNEIFIGSPLDPLIEPSKEFLKELRKEIKKGNIKILHVCLNDFEFPGQMLPKIQTLKKHRIPVLHLEDEVPDAAENFDHLENFDPADIHNQMNLLGSKLERFLASHEVKFGIYDQQ